MSRLGFKQVLIAAASGLVLVWVVTLLAQVPAKASASTGAGLLLAAEQLGAFSPTASPVEAFRELLAMNESERDQFLAARNPGIRTQIVAKVGEYEALDADQRELRLQATELHYYLWPLMNSPATNRAIQLAAVPQRTRKLVADRVGEWDKLPAKVQEQLRENEATFRFFTELAAGDSRQRTNFWSSIPPSRRAKLEAGVRQWQDVPREQRQRMMARFQQFFELTLSEKSKALATLSEPERRQLDRVLEQFGALGAQQRSVCISSFEKFAGLSIEERERFLKNAERWKLMSPKEREDWKQLVTELSNQPPMPPGLGLPPMPPGMCPPPPLPP